VHPVAERKDRSIATCAPAAGGVHNERIVWSRRFTRAAAANPAPLAFYRALLALECAIVFVALPLALLVVHVPFIVPLALTTILSLVYLRRHRVPLATRSSRHELLRVLGRFALVAATLVCALAFFAPHQLAPHVPQLALLILYPLISVWPQEVLYRSFFFERYEPLFGRAIPFASAIAFAFLHIVYANLVAVAMTLAGGLWFSATYLRTRSLPLAWLEHSLYGLFVFSIGLGEFFYSARFW
jgi:hypothetical protein